MGAPRPPSQLTERELLQIEKLIEGKIPLSVICSAYDLSGVPAALSTVVKNRKAEREGRIVWAGQPVEEAAQAIETEYLYGASPGALSQIRRMRRDGVDEAQIRRAVGMKQARHERDPYNTDPRFRVAAQAKE